MQKKEKKLLKRFWDWPFPPPPLKVDADDDGRVGIWIAPLPDGTAELKSQRVRHGVKNIIMTSKISPWRQQVCHDVKNM